ncbi:hypothetical protein BKN38_00260 [Helicobacter sp. CLO-3]|nr:hypothetical protein BA723_03130 [Helicobacter sp. CLO-3]OHU85872.1 hypothetical protein BKN38_00260 [Helicobacter sp. CLO-3]
MVLAWIFDSANLWQRGFLIAQICRMWILQNAVLQINLHSMDLILDSRELDMRDFDSQNTKSQNRF